MPGGNYTWECVKCHKAKVYDKRVPDPNWICVNCQVAASRSKPSAGGGLAPVATNTSKRNTDTPGLASIFSNEDSPIGPLPRVVMQPLPLAALVVLLEGVGGSLVMDMSEITRDRPELTITSEWVSFGGETRLEIRLTEENDEGNL